MSYENMACMIKSMQTNHKHLLRNTLVHCRFERQQWGYPCGRRTQSSKRNNVRRKRDGTLLIGWPCRRQKLASIRSGKAWIYRTLC